MFLVAFGIMYHTVFQAGSPVAYPLWSSASLGNFGWDSSQHHATSWSPLSHETPTISMNSLEAISNDDVTLVSDFGTLNRSHEVADTRICEYQPPSDDTR